MYKCRYCGGSVKIDKAMQEHRGFRSIQKKKMDEAIGKFELQKASCTGCGAQVVFNKGEAIANCAFCGRSLVREEFVKAQAIPEFVVPFTILPDEAKDILESWCKKNSGKAEAKALKKKLGDLKGCYLPYELVRGPVDSVIRRVEGGQTYECGGFADEVFVNCSIDLDNRLLDGMEPYNLDELTGFDFAYVAGHQVKVGDITGEELENRIKNEISDDYLPVIQKTLEAKAVSINVNADEILRMPVLLPVYYLSFDGFMAAVNGQTGKVSVRAVKESHYVIFPWWLKALFWDVVLTGIICLIMALFGADTELIQTAGGCIGFFLAMAFLTAYSEHMGNNKVLIEAGRKIFTSKGGPFVRKGGKLTQLGDKLEKPLTKPVFFMNLDGTREAVELKFTGTSRVIRALLLGLIVIFLPAIIALFIVGFDFSQLHLLGGAVWYCLTVPLTPVVLIKFGRLEIYDRPWIYILDEDGNKKRYKKKLNLGYTPGEIVKGCLKALFKPPASLLVWFVIIALIASVWMTAFEDF